MARIKEAKVFTGCHPKTERILYDDLPYLLKQRYNKHHAFFELKEEIDVEWNGYRINVYTGAITDLSSIPRVLEFFGVHRFTPKGEWDCASICHDLICHGAARFPDVNNWNNIRLADQLYRDMGVACGAPKWRARVRYRALRMVGTLKYKYIHGQAPVMEIARV